MLSAKVSGRFGNNETSTYSIDRDRPGLRDRRRSDPVGAVGPAGPLPELDAFLPRWVAHLERQSPSESEWDDDRDRWLREAVLRLEGVVGLERIARKTRKPEALRAWCEALAGRGEWAEAVRACDDAAKLTHISHWQGEFLDGAALAAQQLGRRDATRRLEAAWRGAPSLVRFIRWLLAGTATASTVIKRARKAIEHCRRKGGPPARTVAPSHRRRARRRHEARRGHPGKQATSSLRSRSNSRRLLPRA